MARLDALRSAGADYTGDYTYLKGMYAIGPERLPYYAITMSIADAAKHLVLARDVVFDVERPTRLEELFQRDLDVERARSEIQTYLKQPEGLKFFNSLTVVLLPTAAGDAPVPLDRYPDGDEGAPDPPAGDTLRRIDVGPIQLREMGEDGVGLMRWNTRRISPVVIDGQHRLFALRELLEDRAFVKHLNPQSTQIPLLTLILDQRAGYEPPSGGPSGVLAACRNIFIDINKNAKSVLGARLALLNDQSIADCAMRQLLTEEIGTDPNDPPAREGQIPLALVDWHSEVAKFDRSLYLSSVLALRDAVAQALALRTPDPYDLDEWSAHLDLIEARLAPRPDDGWDRPAMDKRLKDAARNELPFDLTQRETAAAASGFVATRGALIVEPLLRAKPYAELIQAYRKAELLDGPFELWLGHDQEGKRAFERLSTAEVPDADIISKTAKAKHPLAFQVVFQKGLLTSVQKLDGFREEALLLLTGEAHEGAKASVAALTNEWLKAFDKRIASRLNEHAFWRGFGVRLDGTIDFTRSTPDAIAGFVGLALLAPFSDWGRAPARSRWTPEQAQLAQLLDGQSIGDGATVSPYGKATPGQQFLASSWLYDQLTFVRPGRITEPNGQLVRVLAGPWLRSVSKYLAAAARADGVELGEDVRLLAAAHGGKRLADVRAHT